MAISNLTVYTGNVPLIGQTQIEFDTNTGNILGYLNGFGTDLNARVGEINTVISTTNGLATAAASSEANAAISATNAGLAATRAEAVVIPTTATYSMDVIDTRNTALSKAGFEAIARDNRDKFAGSGFVEFGKDTITTASDANINSGMWVRNTFVNTIYLGRENVSSSSASISKTQFPYANINGIVHNISFINDALNDKILLPPAPTVYPTGTTNHLITEGLAIAHADASNSGLIVNGKFDTDTTGWTPKDVTAVSFDANRLAVTQIALATNSYAYQSFECIVGKKYVVEFETDGVAGKTFLVHVGNTSTSSEAYSSGTITVGGRYTFEFTATSVTQFIKLYSYGNTTGDTVYYDNIAVFPKDAISRSDLVFLESWHEDTSEKGVLYDLGNVKYKGTISAGTAGTFSGSDTYSLFGNWQEPSALVGNSISIASLTQAQLKTFVGKPENNCYYDGDKLIQVRYRVRTVAGLGDEWGNVDTNAANYLLSATAQYVRPKGKNTLISEDIGYSSAGGAVYGNAKVGFNTLLAWNGNGVFTASDQYADRDGFLAGSYNGQCFALPIALVHRRNQGMYNVTFNSNGTKLASDSLPWYSTSVSFTSISDCFTASKLLTNSGSIASAVSGRPD